MALVYRGVPRMLVFACPDGCGDVLPVNLDARADKAWHFYQRAGANTLFPSVWRDEGCQAHFILWNDVIYWGGFDRRKADPALRGSVLSKLDPDAFKAYFDLALALDEVPWSVLVACEQLVGEGLAEEAPGKRKGHFKRRVKVEGSEAAFPPANATSISEHVRSYDSDDHETLLARLRSWLTSKFH